MRMKKFKRRNVGSTCKSATNCKHRTLWRDMRRFTWRSRRSHWQQQQHPASPSPIPIPSPIQRLPPPRRCPWPLAAPPSPQRARRSPAAAPRPCCATEPACGTPKRRDQRQQVRTAVTRKQSSSPESHIIHLFALQDVLLAVVHLAVNPLLDGQHALVAQRRAATITHTAAHNKDQSSQVSARRTAREGTRQLTRR